MRFKGTRYFTPESNYHCRTNNGNTCTAWDMSHLVKMASFTFVKPLNYSVKVRLYHDFTPAFNALGNEVMLIRMKIVFASLQFMMTMFKMKR